MIPTESHIPRNSKYHPRFTVRRVLDMLARYGGVSTQRMAQLTGMSVVEVGWALCRLQEIGLVRLCLPTELWIFVDERSTDLF